MFHNNLIFYCCLAVKTTIFQYQAPAIYKLPESLLIYLCFKNLISFIRQLCLL